MKRFHWNVSLMVTLIFVLVGSSALAQLGVREEMELSASVIQTQRKAIVAYNMDLTEEEGAAFWPLYNDYRAEINKIVQRQMKLITDYAESYVSESLTDEQAGKLIKESFSIQKDMLKVKESFVKKFEKIMPTRKVMRFYQINNKLDAIVNVGLARDIPLAE